MHADCSYKVAQAAVARAIGHGVSFPKDPNIRLAATELISQIIQQLPAYATEESSGQLARKLLLHFVRTGQATDTAIRAFDCADLIAALIDEPDAINQPRSIAHIVRSWRHRLRQRDLESDYADGGSEVWHDNEYVVREATRPEHLVWASTALYHCVGKLYNQRSLSASGLREGDPAALRHLVYWQKIRQGRSRIYSFGRRLQKFPLATIEYEIERNDFIEIGGLSDLKLGPYWQHLRPLCKALSALMQQLPGARASGLPRPMPGRALLNDGDYSDLTRASVRTALAGTLAVSSETCPMLLDDCLSHPGINIDITNATEEQKAFFQQVRGSIVSRGRALALPHLLSIGSSLSLPRAMLINMPKLQYIQGTFFAPKAQFVDLPRLEYVGEVQARRRSRWGQSKGHCE